MTSTSNRYFRLPNGAFSRDADKTGPGEWMAFSMDEDGVKWLLCCPDKYRHASVHWIAMVVEQGGRHIPCIWQNGGMHSVPCDTNITLDAAMAIVTFELATGEYVRGM